MNAQIFPIGDHKEDEIGRYVCEVIFCEAHSLLHDSIHHFVQFVKIFDAAVCSILPRLSCYEDALR